MKVGGHQASSASVVSIMTALWFEHLRGPDRVSVKPHASPVLHAIEYLLGQLDAKYLTTLREFGGLQSYPSRLKDPVPADFSTGSVGIGATATIWSAIAHRYVAGHFEVPQGGRQVALLGDAELDEGAIWETLVDPVVPRLGEVLWIVDLNRQSLDRIVPDIAAGRIAAMFEAAGWQTITVKYGRWLRELFERPGGEALRRRIDEMPNEEYQRLLRSGAGELRERLPGSGRGRARARPADRRADDDELLRAIRDLGGHDLGDLLDAFAQADAVTDRPSVIFAYTIKAWRLRDAGAPGEPLGAAVGGADGGARARNRRRPGRSVGAVSRRLARGRAMPRGGADGWRARRSSLRSRRRRRLPISGRAHSGQGVDAAGVRPVLRRSVAQGARGGGAGRDREPGRGVVDEPRRVDQPRRDLAPGRSDRLVRRRHRHARALARVRARPAHRARHRRGQPGRACSASWARRGRATARRCCRSGRCMTRSSVARWSRGRSACTPAASRFSSARRRA